MRGTLSILTIAVLSGAVAACATSDIPDLPVKGGAFDEGLRDGYLRLAEAEFDETDIVDGNTFAERARLAAMGTPTRPEELAAREIPSNYQADLAAARSRLVKALDGGGIAKAPADAAEAQVGFDCWMQEAEENIQPEHIAGCRRDFEAAMRRLDAAIAAPKVASTSPAAGSAAPASPQKQTYVVFFDLNSAKIGGTSASVIKDAAAFAKAKKAGHVYLVGYADRSGPSPYNMKLSERRVDAVSRELTGMGITKASLNTAARGENDPIVPTKDGVTEPRNRRVEISIVY